MIEAELPDGTILEFPDGTSQEVVQRVVKQRLNPAPAQEAPKPSFGQMFKDEIVNSVPVQAGLGALRGAGSIGSTLMAPVDAAARAMGVQNSFIGRDDRRDAMQQGVEHLGADPSGIAFNAGKIGGEIAGTAGIGGVLAKGAQGLKAAPAIVNALRTGGMSTGGATGLGAQLARVAGGAATGGAAAGMVNPEDAGTGAMIGGAMPVAAQAAGAVGRGIGSIMRPSAETAAVAQKAQQYGIPVGLGDVSENKAVQAMRSILRDAPVSGGMAQNAQEVKQKAFNKAIGATFGASDDKLTLPVIDQAKARMGAEFDRIWNNNVLQVDPQLLKQMGDLDTIAGKLPKNEGASLSAEIQDVFSKMVPDANGNMQIPGDTANKFQQYLRRRAESSVGLRNELGDLRQALIQGFNRSVNPADAAALTMTRGQYKAFKTVEPILRSAELGVAGRAAGDVPAALLPQAVNKSYGNLSNVPLADLSQIGSKFMVDRTAQTGGSARAALQNTAIGAALMGTGGLPALAAGVPAAAGLQKLLQSPAAAQALMGQGQVSPELLQALRAAQLAAPVVSAQ